MAATEIRLGPLAIRFNPLIAAAVAVTLFSLVRLGLWQLDRAAEKRALALQFEQRQTAHPTAIELVDPSNTAQMQNLKISLAGSFLESRDVLITNRTYRGQFGYEVVTPFQLASNNHLVFVSRGWIAGPPDHSSLPEIPSITGVQMLTGNVYIPPRQTFYQGQPPDGRWPMMVSYFDVAVMASAFNEPSFPYTIRLDETSPGDLTRPWPSLKLKANSSESYALQWFAMALGVFIVTLYLSVGKKRE
jgi:surfeit locus 1 family protein